MKKRFLSLVIAGASVSLLALPAACSSSDSTSSASSTSSSSGSTPDAGADTAPAATPTFTEIYTTIIAAKCSPCHTTASGDGITSGMLDMSTQAKAYTDLVGAATAGSACSGKGTRVVAGNPDESIMYLKASDDDPTPCGGKMPLGTSGLAAEDSDALKAWIAAGAKND